MRKVWTSNKVKDQARETICNIGDIPLIRRAHDHILVHHLISTLPHTLREDQRTKAAATARRTSEGAAPRETAADFIGEGAGTLAMLWPKTGEADGAAAGDNTAERRDKCTLSI